MTYPANNASLAYATAVGANSSESCDAAPRPSRPARVRFGIFELDPRSGELTGGDQQIVLQRQSLQVMLLLIDSCGEMVTREEIQEKLWTGDVIVDFDHSINQIVRKLRRALGDSAEEPRYIETVARRGYRLKVPVKWVEKTAVESGCTHEVRELPATLRLINANASRAAEDSDRNPVPHLVEGQPAREVSHFRRARYCRQRFPRHHDGSAGISRTTELDVLRQYRASASPAEKLDALRQMLLLLTELVDTPQ